MKIIIDDFNENCRIDAYLATLLQEYSRSQIQTYIKQGNITVNSVSVKPSYQVKNGDEVCIADLVSELKIEPENISVEVVWEDENIVVVNKPSGMITHPTSIEKTGSLVNALLYKYGENLSDVNGEFRRGIVHRLDRNTSGLLIVAKNNDAHDYIAQKMKAHEISKKYLAIVKGVICEDVFEINKPIGRNPNQPHKMCVDSTGKDSLSKVRVLRRYKDATLVEVSLITGRTHQIRVHMASIGHPVYNDTLYGFGKIKIKTEEQVLQSYKLEFPKPFSGEIISLEIPEDEKLRKVINALEALA